MKRCCVYPVTQFLAWGEDLRQVLLQYEFKSEKDSYDLFWEDNIEVSSQISSKIEKMSLRKTGRIADKLDKNRGRINNMNRSREEGNREGAS